MKWGKSALINRVADIPRKGWTDNQLRDLIDSLWRDEYSMRTSGFETAGGPDAIITFSDATRAFGIEPVKMKFSFYQKAFSLYYVRKYTKEQKQLNDTEGLHLIYYSKDQDSQEDILTVIENPTEDNLESVYLNYTIVAAIYWDAQANAALYFGDERHGSEWPPQVNWWAHLAFNGIRDYGLLLTDLVIGDGTDDSHARVGVSAGVMAHEDMLHDFEAVGATAGMPVFYSQSGSPRLLPSNGFPVQGAPGGRLYHNGGGGKTIVGEKRFVLCHIFATNCLLHPVIAVMGQREYDELIEAAQGVEAELDLIDTWLPHQTKYRVSTLIYQTSTGYSNAVKARVAGEITPESLAGIIADDKIPEAKNGWTPDILKQARLTYNESLHQLVIELLDSYTSYFVGGRKFKVESNIPFWELPAQPGMLYLDTDGNAWDLLPDPFDVNTDRRVMAATLYRNTRLGQTPYVGWRMHMWDMAGRTRGNMIKMTGMELLGGFGLTVSEEAGHEHEVNVADGTIRLADIVAEIKDGTVKTFEQRLRMLEARRHYLKTYVDVTDPENPVVTNEWEYQDLPAANVATLDAGHQVVVNELVDGKWQLTSTADGDFSAMWLIATLDHARPLKWITGMAKGTTLEEAKTLNGPETLLAITGAAQFFTDHFAVLARVMVKNIADAPYYELAELKEYEDGEFDEETADRHVTGIAFDETSRELTLTRNAGLPALKATIPGGSAESVQADWNQSDPEEPDFIKNKPSIPADQIQSDWNQSDPEEPDFIKNKPSIPTNTDEKVKIDATDQSPGYLSEKIVQGTNVTISEGTGEYENKLVISAAGGGGGASPPTTISSTTSNDDNGIYHTHALDDLHAGIRSATFASVTIDKKGRVTALSSGSTTSFLGKSTATLYPNAGSSSYDLYAGPVAGTGTSNYFQEYKLTVVENGGNVDYIECYTVKAYDGIVYLIEKKQSSTGLLSVAIINNGTNYYLRITSTVTVKAKCHYVWFSLV